MMATNLTDIALPVSPPRATHYFPPSSTILEHVHPDVRYPILAHFSPSDRIKLMRVSRALYDELVPLVYRRLVLGGKKAVQFAGALPLSEDGELRADSSCPGEAERKLKALECTTSLTLTSIEALNLFPPPSGPGSLSPSGPSPPSPPRMLPNVTHFHLSYKLFGELDYPQRRRADQKPRPKLPYPVPTPRAAAQSLAQHMAPRHVCVECDGSPQYVMGTDVIRAADPFVTVLMGQPRAPQVGGNACPFTLTLHTRWDSVAKNGQHDWQRGPPGLEHWDFERTQMATFAYAKASSTGMMPWLEVTLDLEDARSMPVRRLWQAMNKHCSNFYRSNFGRALRMRYRVWWVEGTDEIIRELVGKVRQYEDEGEERAARAMARFIDAVSVRREGDPAWCDCQMGNEEQGVEVY
ncbi:hypothetical protein IAT38_002999 [Cryptococcus sp. DSM 104549]